MLRSIFGDSRRQDEGMLLETNRVIDAFCRTLRKEYDCSEAVEPKWIRLDLWAVGLQRALNELEQSVYCCEKYRVTICQTVEESMTPEELDDYYRYTYFYKNAFIRIFSVLDKTGYFLDTLYDLQTGRIKHRFSYFTVLRQLHTMKRLSHLENRLFNIKVQYREPMDVLRKKRNLEIHSMNAELIDDFWRPRVCFANRHFVEPIDDNMNDLRDGFSMVVESLLAIFTYCSSFKKL